ncbi:hypothetical protein LCGC14_1975960 [marine sediment metagenome]|uniref:Uncharacterized protein n=1 Tax=marine sediment metagenome TaxID=412755 RepID=A0A0F9HNS1_9ZZZZ
MIIQKMEYDDWQKEIIEDTSKDILLCKGRQIGGTTVFAQKAAKWMAEKGETILVGSITEEQAKLVIVMVKEILMRDYPGAIATVKKDKPTLDKIILKNKGWIRSRAVGTMGDAFKGFTAGINWFNEMSKWPELAFIAIMPTLLTTGGGMWGDSTPFGKFINNTTKKTFFFKCFENTDGRWKIYYKTSPEVIKERKLTEFWTIEKREASLKFLKDQKATMSKSEYSQEYLGLFMDDVSQWFPDELITSCMTEERQDKIDKNAIYFLGVDVARMGEDESTFEIFQLTDKGHLYQIENQTTKKTTLPQTFEHIKQLWALYDFSKIFIDSEGIGVGVFDWLMFDDDTKHITEAIDNSKQIMSVDGRTRKLQKTLKYSHFKMMMETGKVHLLDDSNIFQSFKSVQFAYTNDNLGVRHLKIFGNYTHIAEGSTNAGWGEKSKHLNLQVYSIKV